MTAKEIRCDLYDIRYYYTHRSMFCKQGMAIVKSTIEVKAKRYDEAVKAGGVMLHALYSELYVNGFTQRKAAENWNTTEWQIKYQNKKLIKFLEKKFNEGAKSEKQDT